MVESLFESDRNYIFITKGFALTRSGSVTSLLMNWVNKELVTKREIRRFMLTSCSAALEAGFYEKFGFQAAHIHWFVNEQRFLGRVEAPLAIMIKYFLR